MKRSISGPLSILLVLCMTLSLLPAAALADGEAAETAHWAQQAVDVLNGIYGEGAFSTGETAMNPEAAVKFFEAVGYAGENPSFTREGAAEILTDIYKIPIPSGTSALKYLYDQNIVNGKPNGDLDPTGAVTQAEFAVLTYRVLNFVGGGKGSDVEELTPGSIEYFSWMYLAARMCVSFSSEALEDEFTVETWDGKEGEDGNKLPGWSDRLKASGVSDAKLAEARGAVINDSDVCTGNILQAAVEVVKVLNPESIFDDVAPGSPFYDGVMYLFDRSIIKGYGNGTFNPGVEANRAEVAVLLCRTAEVEFDEEENDWLGTAANAINAINQNGDGYVDWDAGSAGVVVKREEAVVAILKACAEKNNIETEDIEKENTAILSRFSDGGSVSEGNAPYIAYAVSHGLLNGTGDGRLDLTGAATRGQLGILLYRALTGVDSTKMKDYEDSVAYAMGRSVTEDSETVDGNDQDSGTVDDNNQDSGTEADSAEQSGETEETSQPLTRAASLAGEAGEAAVKTSTLTLREDWRLTGELDLDVGENEELIIDGQQGKYYIYEMGGGLTGVTGTVCLKDTILYPQSNGQSGGRNISLDASGVSVAAPAGAAQVTLTGGEGYKVTITDSDHPNVINTSGKITPPASNTTVKLTLTVRDENDQHFYAQITRAVTVPGAGTGSGNSGTGAGVSSPSTSVSSPSTSAGGNTTTVEVSTSSTTSGTAAKASVSSESMDKAVASVIAEAAKQNTAPVVEVEVKTSPAATSLELSLPAASLEKLAGAENASLVITSAIAEVALDHAALGAVAGQATGGTVVLEVAPVAESTLTKAQKEAVGEAGVTVLDVSLFSNGVVIDDYKGGRLTVTLPYTLSEGASADDVSVYYLGDDGALTNCDASYANGKVTFTTSA